MVPTMSVIGTLSLLACLVRAQNHSSGGPGRNISDTLVRVPTEWTYLLPTPFNSTLEDSWLNSTTSVDQNVTDTLKRASQSRFVSYSDEFSRLVGNIGSADVTNIQCPTAAPNCAFEAGVWLPDTNEVWFSYQGFLGNGNSYNQTITSFSLDNNTARELNPSFLYPLGGYYWKGKVYMSGSAVPNAVRHLFSVNPKTLHVEPIVNSFFGIPLASLDDLVVTSVGKKDYIFFTTLDTRHIAGDSYPPARFDTAVWRWDIEEKLLTPVISNTDIIAPNGIRVSPDGRTLYVTNTPFTSPDEDKMEVGYSSQSNAIYAYDLTDQAVPINRRLFGLTRTGFSNGLHVDNKGRIWTADNDGINVRSPDGRILGLFNYQPFHDPDIPVIGNFALAGNKLVIGGLTQAVVYELKETLVTPGNSLTN